MAEILISLASAIVEYLVDPTVRQFRYVCCFNSIINDFKEQREGLAATKAHVEGDVERALRNVEQIEEKVEKWQNDVRPVMEDAEKMEHELQVDMRCFNGWCPNWYWRYRMGRKAVKKTTIMSELEEKGKFDKVGHRPINLGKRTSSSGSYIPFESTKRAFDQVIEAVKRENCSRIGLYGMGGVGKTTLAKEVRKKILEESLFDDVVMTTVSQHPDLRNVQGHIASSLGLNLERETEQTGRDLLEERLSNGSKTLIILDDVWKQLNLEELGVPFGSTACKVLITTRSRHVCDVMGSEPNIPVNILSEDDAWTLFQRSACLVNESSKMMQTAKEISKKCNGLPVAIVSLGRALKGRTLSQWQKASLQLKRSRPVDNTGHDRDTNAYVCLEMSYDFLDNKETKLCFLLCSLLLEDDIPMETLTTYAAGIGIYQSVDSIDEIRINVCATIDNLRDACLLLDTGDDKFVKMHDVVRDCALWIASKGENMFLVKHGLEEWPRDERFEECRAISLFFEEVKNFPDVMPCPKLEILFLIANGSLPESFFDRMEAVKVLRLCCENFSSNSIECLTNLQSLEFLFCQFGDMSSLGKLQNLKILRIEGSTKLYNPTYLPDEVGELSKLRVLDLSRVFLTKIPSNVIQRLTRLEELYIPRIYSWIPSYDGKRRWAGKDGRTDTRLNASLSELLSLPRLAILLLHISTGSIPEGFAFPSLVRYDIFVGSNDEGVPRDYPNCRTLRFDSVDITVINAFNKLLPSVEYLILKGMSFEDIIPSIDHQGLTELIELEVWQCNELRYLVDPKQLSKMPEEGFLGNLQKLEVYRCKELHSLFPWKVWQQLDNLKEVKVSFCDELKEIFQIDESLHIRGRSSREHLGLQNLRVMQVTHCAKLEYIFPISIHGFVQLEELTIEATPGLKQVFFSHGKEITAQTGDECDQ